MPWKCFKSSDSRGEDVLVAVSRISEPIWKHLSFCRSIREGLIGCPNYTHVKYHLKSLTYVTPLEALVDSTMFHLEVDGVDSSINLKHSISMSDHVWWFYIIHLFTPNRMQSGSSIKVSSGYRVKIAPCTFSVFVSYSSLLPPGGALTQIQLFHAVFLL